MTRKIVHQKKHCTLLFTKNIFLNDSNLILHCMIIFPKQLFQFADKKIEYIYTQIKAHKNVNIHQ